MCDCGVDQKDAEDRTIDTECKHGQGSRDLSPSAHKTSAAKSGSLAPLPRSRLMWVHSDSQSPPESI
jgi:hypothetical protein